jgi:hypothetical protein
LAVQEILTEEISLQRLQLFVRVGECLYLRVAHFALDLVRSCPLQTKCTLTVSPGSQSHLTRYSARFCPQTNDSNRPKSILAVRATISLTNPQFFGIVGSWKNLRLYSKRFNTLAMKRSVLMPLPLCAGPRERIALPV